MPEPGSWRLLVRDHDPQSQGSEYPVVVVVVLTMQAYIMLGRELIYTAVTRARKLLVLVGSRKARSGDGSRGGGHDCASG